MLAKAATSFLALSDRDRGATEYMLYGRLWLLLVASFARRIELIFGREINVRANAPNHGLVPLRSWMISSWDPS